MKLLTTLNPQWTGLWRKDSGEGVTFDCPVCPPEAKHRLLASLTNPLDGGAAAPGAIWTREGDTFETLTLSPSIDYPNHWHGWVERGRVFDVSESPLRALDPATGKVLHASPLQAIAMLKKNFFGE